MPHAKRGVMEEFWTAVTFLIVGLVLVFAEVWLPGYFIAVPGGALFIMGGIGLIAPNLMFNSPWSWILWPSAAIVATLGNIWVYKKWAPAERAPVTMAGDSLPGKTGRIVKETGPGLRGQVRIEGGNWSARTEGPPLAVGQKVRVVRVEGVYVFVEAVEE
jgi:inner membrane protein